MEEQARPDPDALLRRVQAEEQKAQRGLLTIFFGAAPGVGKTFAMLQEAGHELEVQGRDVVAGVVETHGRFETTTLLAGFELLPKRKLSYRGNTVEEFDLDAALERKPSLMLVDELAHTNVPGSRHDKRWQDVEELLDAGIDVYTTLNVQHVESLNDVVAQVTGVIVRETVPDSVIDAADEIKLVDLPPDELLERLREGKVYLPANIERALENFFRKGNLIALRELALRKTAERVEADMRAWREEHRVEKTWAASDRLLVCLSPSPYSANLLRVGRRMAAGLHIPWYAVNVETSATQRLPAEDRARMLQHLRLAEQLGAETATLTGERAAQEILRFAREKNVTKIVVGKPRIRRLRDRFGTSFVDELILGSGDIDIYATAGEPEHGEPVSIPKPARRHGEWWSYVAATLTVALATLLSFGLFGRQHLADVVMMYLLGIVLVAMRGSFRVSIYCAVLSVVSFNFFFIPPYLMFAVSDVRHVVTFGVMLLVSIVIASLTRRVRNEAQIARRSESRIAVLYGMSRELSQTQGLEALIRVAASHIESVLESRVAVFTRNKGEVVLAYTSDGFEVPEKDGGVVQWVATHRREAGLGTSTLSGTGGLYLPLWASGTERALLGVVGIYPSDERRLADPEQRRLADALATQLAMAVERGELAEEAARVRVQIETEQLRNTLLSSVSHDLRTPLAVMQGVASSLVEDDADLQQATRKELAQALLEETERLERLVTNLLDMMRLESGAVRVRKEWTSLEEVIGTALARTERRLKDRRVTARVPGDLLAPFDAVLIEQALVNMLENAAKYTPAGTAIEVNAALYGDEVVVEVADRGPGIPSEEQQRIFDKFQRLSPEASRAGVGLGLAICRAIVVAHGGRIWIENRDGGGAAFKLSLPLEGAPPSGGLPEIEEVDRP
jgi:two-component system sensor histidine kinase KdpD